jgi:GH43 family beta-xylosidase
MILIVEKLIRILAIICLGGFLVSCGSMQTSGEVKNTDAVKIEQTEETKKPKTFTNPIVIRPSADPWVIHVGGYYYYTYSHGTYIGIKRARELQRIGDVGETAVWVAPSDKEYSQEIWAPELHYFNGRWYIYVAADNGENENHRMFVLEGGSDPNDPTSQPFKLKGKILEKSDKWAIDGTVLQLDDDSLYFIWSGWEGDINGQQNLYIAPMSNPWTLSGERVLISTPNYDWETEEMAINEGPQILKNDGKIFIIYSASASWTAQYCLGMLFHEGGDMLTPSSWKKVPGPVFKASPENSTFGVGHCSFVKSPDEKEDWIVYPGMTEGLGWDYRDVRAQKFTWDENGRPVFGIPVAVKTPVEVPSGQE